MASVVVIGAGYVGLPTAALIAEAGHEVLAVDIDERIVELLRAGRCPVAEQGIRELVERTVAAGRLRASSDPEQAEVFIICVPTPVRSDRSADLSLVDSALRSALGSLRPGNLLILESTSPIGTIENVFAPALRAAGLDPLTDVDVCYCPERVFPGDTIREMRTNRRIVGGLTPRAAERAAQLYRGFCEAEIVLTTPSTAEFAKLMENTFRDVNIALANVFGHISEEAGLDVLDAIEIANQHPRVHIHRPGAGVGGHCIPVDPWFLAHYYPDVTEFLTKARRINDGQPRHLLDRAEGAGLRPGARVALLGVSYRGNIDDTRASPSEILTEVMSERGYLWVAHDPFISRWTTPAGTFPIHNDLAKALADTEAAFLMTDHDAYRALSPADFIEHGIRLVVDGRRLLDAAAFQDAGVTIVSVGAPTLRAVNEIEPRRMTAQAVSGTR